MGTAIMMLESKSTDLSKSIIKYIPVGFFFSIFLLIPVVSEISSQFDNNISMDTYTSFYSEKYYNWYDLIDSIRDVEVYGQILYSYFVLHFLIAGFILLLVLIGVVYLTNNFNTNKILEQSIFKQLSRNSTFFFN